MNDTASNYNIMELDGHQLVGYEGRLYVPVALRQHTIEWYHHYLNHPGGKMLLLEGHGFTMHHFL